ncbi:putative branched-chain amino acid transport protein [Actinoplanes missouriensis 431]|uniref:Putative branched-chain amino acid transport protein n=1 Tax=Actinoplanes missouriensis (strain ATCC 14538 / DSM 43046 / CBS 188.64 / JCM 3121 / NBRC 102363 / NCIMB 12654 / NRRL B-3342 / UNCC 431) TaxID=512565 RepID=I0H1B1_ACTM4|nr:branched-chain amino acid ABC transporter permease [Actinoplanes missouriensis]BAL86798.1 putative branched-chain amino acid transport protein [Actinoplanes missouriensis 431]
MSWDIILGVSLESLINATMIAYALAAIGLNVHFGYTGLLNFGQSAFLGVAAYGMAMMVATFGLPFWVGVAVGLAGAVVLALLLGIPTLRLRADYLAIVTIAAAEIVRLLFRSVSLSEWTGGSDGLQAFSDDFYAVNPYSSSLDIGTIISFDARELWVMTVGWVLVAISLLIVFLAMRSPWGRVIKAIREDEDAVRSLGKNVVSYKMQSLILGGVLGSLGGFIIALKNAAIQPDTYGTEFTFYMYTIVILGGAARVFGPVVGSMIFWFLLTFVNAVLPPAIAEGYIPSWLMTSTQAGAVGYILVGLGLILLLIFRPQGIFGDKKEVMLDGR